MSFFHSTNRVLLIILALALIVRLVALAVTDVHPVSDAAEYIRLANTLLSEHRFADNGVVTAYRLPSYPFFLASVYTILQSNTLVQIIQILMDICSCYFLFRIGSLLFSERSGLIAATIWAIVPSAVVQPIFLLTETSFTALFLGSLWLLISIKKQNKTYTEYAKIFGLGIIWGLCAFVKPNLILAPLSLIVLGYLKERRITKRVIIEVSVIFVGIGMVLTPWCIRNYQIFGKYSLCSNDGVNFWIGNNENATGTYRYPAVDNPIDSISDEFRRSARGYELGWQFIRKEPMKAIMVTGKKIAWFFALESPTAIALSQGSTKPPEGTRYRDLYRQTPLSMLLLMNLPYCILMIAGIFGFARFPSQSALLLFFIGLWVFTHCIYYSFPRYHFPILPLFALGGAGIATNVLSSRRAMIWAVMISLFLLAVWVIEIAMFFFVT